MEGVVVFFIGAHGGDARTEANVFLAGVVDTTMTGSTSSSSKSLNKSKRFLDDDASIDFFPIRSLIVAVTAVVDAVTDAFFSTRMRFGQ